MGKSKSCGEAGFCQSQSHYFYDWRCTVHCCENCTGQTSQTHTLWLAPIHKL